MKPNPLPFLLDKWWHTIPKPTTRFTGQVIIITGANTGLGLCAATSYAQLGASQIILAVRDKTKGAVARQEIQAVASPGSLVEVWELDMGSYSSITRFASRARELPRLDVVVLNAGAAPGDYVLSAEGWETLLQVNVLSTAALGLLLLPKLQEAAGSERSHLLVVTSEAHKWLEESDFSSSTRRPLHAANVRPEDGQWNPLLQNAKSKLFAMYVARELSCLADGRVIVTSVCPGACKSDLMRELIGKSFGQRLFLNTFDVLFNKPTEQGGWAYVWATTLDESANGKWYRTSALAEPGILVTSEEGKRMGKEVWAEILESLRGSIAEFRHLREA